ncbi:MAG: ATP-binding protein, partial [Pseudomonadota bacterium]
MSENGKRGVETERLRELHSQQSRRVRSLQALITSVVFLATLTLGFLADRQLLILTIGGFATITLAVFFFALNRAEARALTFADSMVRAYRRSNVALMTANSNLEHFATVATQDLRTTIRGIASLTDYIEEDLTDVLETDSNHPTFHGHLTRMRRRIKRLDDTLNGLQIYASATETNTPPSEVDVLTIAKRLRDRHQLAPEQLIVTGAVRTLFADQSALNKVLDLIIDNAVLHHDSPNETRIVLRLSIEDAHYQIVIKDNGPGIDSRFW